MIFAVLSRCRICLQITTREMVTQSLLSFAPLALPSVPLPSPQKYAATSRSLARSLARSPFVVLSPLANVLIPHLYHSEWTTLFRCKASTTPHYPKHLNPDSWSPFSDSQSSLQGRLRISISSNFCIRSYSFTKAIAIRLSLTHSNCYVFNIRYR